MKICQVHPGCGVDIPPIGWGAIEKIIWEFTKNLRSLGHTVDIKYANEISIGEYDVVHAHVANLCEVLREKEIPYIYQFHDHHAYYYGKESFVFKQNIEAILGSKISLIPSKYLVEYFDTQKAIYFSHGVNTDFYRPTGIIHTGHKLLCFANNGVAGIGGYDRKGFEFAIKAAMSRKLPITIAGPRNNDNFFKENPWIFGYPKLSIEYDLSQDESVDLYNRHTIFMHPSELEAGHPNLTILEAAACGLPVNGCIESEVEFKGMWKGSRNVIDLVNGLDAIIQNYEEYRSSALSHAQKLSWKNRTLELIKIYESYER